MTAAYDESRNYRHADVDVEVDVVDVLAQAERLYASFSDNYYLTYVYKLD